MKELRFSPGVRRAVGIAAVAVPFALFGACGCSGGGDHQHETTSGSAAPAEDATAAPAAAARPAAEPAAGTAGKGAEMAIDPNVQACLAKVSAGDLREAYPVCLEAAKVAPGNQEVQAALVRSKEAYAQVADAAAAGQKAVDDANKAAADGQKAVEDANKAADAVNGMKPPGF